MRHSSFIKWGVALGFALAGFFDGILLHQILQWHHLLSLVPGIGDLRMQVLWDGYFHALMYVVAAAALFGLWQARRAANGVPLFGAVLVGFGLWHAIDAVLSHWLLGIHRVKIDSASPLAWDLLWFAVFGILPMALGWLMLRRGVAGPMRPASLISVLVLAGITGTAGAWALRPPSGQPFTTVVFRPGLTPSEVLGALSAADARLVWSDSSMGVIVVAVPPERRWRFYYHGALMVAGTGLPAGCMDWSSV